jgi:hypothetical protein
MSLKNKRYANSKLITAYGLLQFDEQGVVQTELNEQAVAALSQLKGFEKEEVKAVKVEEEVKVEETPIEVTEEETQPEETAEEESKEEKPASKRGAHLNKRK